MEDFDVEFEGTQTPAIMRQSPDSPPVFIMCASVPACAWQAQLCASFIAVALSGRCRGRMLRSPPVEVFPLVEGSPVGTYWWSCSWARRSEVQGMSRRGFDLNFQVAETVPYLTP